MTNSVENHCDIMDEIIKEIHDYVIMRLGFPSNWTINYEINNSTVYIFIYNNDNKLINTLASWTLVQLPGCCGVCISTGAFVNYPYRGKGLGAYFNTVRIKIAKLLGYGQLLCTVTSDNISELKILQKNDWINVNNFVNPRTGHKILTWIKIL